MIALLQEEGMGRNLQAASCSAAAAAAAEQAPALSGRHRAQEGRGVHAGT